MTDFETAMRFVNERIDAMAQQPGSMPVSDEHGGVVVPTLDLAMFLAGVNHSEELAHEILTMAESCQGVVAEGLQPVQVLVGPLVVIALLGAQLGMDR